VSEAKIVVVGSANMDVYSWTDHLPEPGETVLGNRFWMGMGGKGANQAVGACRLGARVSMVGRVGDDLFGRQMLDTLAGHGVDCRYLQPDPAADSGVALVLVDRHAENVIVVNPGANMRITPADVDAAADRIRTAGIVLLQLEIPLAVVERTLAVAREGRAQCILNPAPARPLSDDILRQVDLLTPNQIGLTQLRSECRVDERDRHAQHVG
jgi:ribokinase